MHQIPENIELRKCLCGSPVCDYHGFNFGTFHQGTGFDKETAEEIVRLVNVARQYERNVEAERRKFETPLSKSACMVCGGYGTVFSNLNGGWMCEEHAVKYRDIVWVNPHQEMPPCDGDACDRFQGT